MKNILKYLFLIVAAACLSGSSGTICAANQQSSASGNTTEALASKPLANDNAFNTVAYRSLPALTVGGKEGVSAPFAGMSKGSLLVAGGCNFPGKPAAEGGEKVFYRDIYELENPASDKSNWKKAGQLPEALAYGVAVTVPEGLVCIGGTNGKESSAKVFLLEKQKGGIKCVNLPALPQALDNMAGAFGGGYIYVAGGQTNGRSSRAAYRLSYPHATSWERLPDIPGAARLQPAAAVQNNGVTNCFYLMGGFQPADASHPGFANTDGLVFNPQTKQWSRVAEIIPHGTKTPMTLVGAAALTSGCAHIILWVASTATSSSRPSIAPWRLHRQKTPCCSIPTIRPPKANWKRCATSRRNTCSIQRPGIASTTNCSSITPSPTPGSPKAVRHSWHVLAQPWWATMANGLLLAARANPACALPT